MVEQPEHWIAPLPEGWAGIARDSRTQHYWCVRPGTTLPVCVGCMGYMTDWSLVNPCGGWRGAVNAARSVEGVLVALAIAEDFRHGA